MSCCGRSSANKGHRLFPKPGTPARFWMKNHPRGRTHITDLRTNTSEHKRRAPHDNRQCLRSVAPPFQDGPVFHARKFGPIWQGFLRLCAGRDRGFPSPLHHPPCPSPLLLSAFPALVVFTTVDPGVALVSSEGVLLSGRTKRESPARAFERLAASAAMGRPFGILEGDEGVCLRFRLSLADACVLGVCSTQCLAGTSSTVSLKIPFAAQEVAHPDARKSAVTV